MNFGEPMNWTTLSMPETHFLNEVYQQPIDNRIDWASLTRTRNRQISYDELSYYERSLFLIQKTKDNLEFSFWKYLSKQPWALSMLHKHPNEADWKYLSSQEWAMPLLREHPNKIDWYALPMHLWALPLLLEFPNKFKAFMMRKYARCHMYKHMAESKNALHEELAAVINHPDYVAEHISFGFEVETYEYPRQHLWAHVWSC